MIDVGDGYLGIPAVETAGFKMINVSRTVFLRINSAINLGQQDFFSLRETYCCCSVVF